MFVDPATLEVKNEGISIQGQPRQRDSETPFQQISQLESHQ
jgi:hypothetical protein